MEGFVCLLEFWKFDTKFKLHVLWVTLKPPGLGWKVTFSAWKIVFPGLKNPISLLNSEPEVLLWIAHFKPFGLCCAIKSALSLGLLSPYSTRNWVCVGFQTQMKSTPKKRNVHGQREKFAFGTQRNLYSTDLRWGFALGNANFNLTQVISSVFRYQHVGIDNANFGVGCPNQRQYPTQMVLHRSGI